VLEVVAGLLEEFPVEQVAEAALADVRAEVPDFLAIDPEQMREDVSGALVLAVAVIRNGVDRGGLEGDALRSIGAMRAEQGVDIDAMLAGFRIVARTAIEAVLDLAASQGVDAGVTLELTRAVWRHCDDAAAALATGHRGFTESAALTSTSTSPGEAPLRRLVHGGLGPASVLEACAELGLDPDAGYVVVVAREPGGTGRDRLLASYTDSGAGRLVGLAATPPRDPWGVPVGFGDEVLPGDLRLSLEGALIAFEMAGTFGLADPQHPDDVRLLRAVHEQPELGDAFVERCFGHLDEPRRAAARQTLQAWFAAYGSVDAAADALFVHRNTLRYRLRTYAESAGLNLDRPEDAFTVWWALRRLDEREHLV
jgi:putative transposase